MALTIAGYQIPKTDAVQVAALKNVLTVRPYVPSVFVKPQFVKKYKVFKESEEFLYVPKHFGIESCGPFQKSTRDVAQTDAKYWEFAGAIREAQKPVVDAFLKPEPHDGVISLQTGGGKTVCALYIASQLKLPTLVLVHNTFLRDQWVDRIRAFLPKARIGTVQGDKAEVEGRDIVVGMLQTISMKDLPAGTFKSIGLVVCDECHHIASEAFSQAVPKITSKYMLGLSATPERKDRLMHVIHWFLGPLLFASDAADKVDGGVRVEVVEFAPPDESFNEIIYNNSGVMFTTLMVNKVVEYAPRNAMLASLIEDVCADPARKMLVLTDRVEHAKTLFNLLPDALKNDAGILSSGMKPAVRDEFCAVKRILIGTYQLCREGFDVASLNTLLMATSRPDVEQIVGRILRTEKAKRETEPLILDVVDPAFRRQFQERLALYKKRNYQVEKVEI